MQPQTNTRATVVHRTASQNQQGRINMPVGEVVTLASLGKWLVGLILAPWLWYERKRVDKLREELTGMYFTKLEVKEQISGKTDPLQEDMKEVRDTMKVMSENIVAISVTIARIDERSKNRSEGHE